MGRKVHMLVTGDHAGPAASGYPLLGADLIVDADKRPFGYVDDMQFERGVRGPGQRSPITMFFIEGDGQKILVEIKEIDPRGKLSLMPVIEEAPAEAALAGDEA